MDQWQPLNDSADSEGHDDHDNNPSHLMPPQTDSTEPEQSRSAQAQEVKDEQSEAKQNIRDSDPMQTVEHFDWDDLHGRYHDRMDELHRDEDKLTEEWKALCQYYNVWASAGQHHEAERTFQRLRTRMVFVQNVEKKQETARQRYSDVVKAFEGALALLKSDDLND